MAFHAIKAKSNNYYNGIGMTLNKTKIVNIRFTFSTTTQN